MPDLWDGKLISETHPMPEEWTWRLRKYKDYLTGKVFRGLSGDAFTHLMSFLFDVPFIPSMEMDENRAEDRKLILTLFERQTSTPAAKLLKRPCSMLEMMVALAVRCEDNIMNNPDYGDRTHDWFAEMICSLGMGLMTNSEFREREARELIHVFNRRAYRRNGSGGLFTVPDFEGDMREMEIWYQMMAYLCSIGSAQE